MTTAADWLSRSAISALPCENIDKLMRRCEPDTGRPICNACKRRPAVLALLEAVRREAIVECALVCHEYQQGSNLCAVSFSRDSA